mgnify:CR=1 FL=1
MKKLIIFPILFLFLFIFGCGITPFASPIITGVIMWHEGEAHKYYNEEAKTIYRATKSSLRELDYKIHREDARNGSYFIVAGDKDLFKIYVRQVKPHITEVKVRVNFMGNKPYAELLYKQIDLNSDTVEFDAQGMPTKISKPSLK